MSKKFKSSLEIEKEIQRLQEEKKAIRSEELKQAKQYKNNACELLGNAILIALGVSWDKINPHIIIGMIYRNKENLVDNSITEDAAISPKERLKQYRTLKNIGHRPMTANDAERLREAHTAENLERKVV